MEESAAEKVECKTMIRLKGCENLKKLFRYFSMQVVVTERAKREMAAQDDMDGGGGGGGRR